MSELKRLLLCTYYWPPSGGSGVQRSLKFAKYLPQFDIEATILTVDTETATYPILDESLEKEIINKPKVLRTKSKEPFKAYEKISGNKTTPSSGFANDGKVGLMSKVTRFIRGNFFIPDARKGWNKSAIKAASKLIEQNKIDVVLTTSPPHSSQLIGLKLKQKYGLPWIADLRDPWTDIYYYKDLYPTWFAKKIDSYYERLVLENADKIIVVSESIKNLFLRKSTKIKADNVVIIPNGYDSADFSDQTNINKEFTISYTGSVAESYDLETFVQACKIAFTDKKRVIKLRFVGSSKELLLPILEQYGLKALSELIPTVDHKTSIEYLQSSDALLLFIPNTIENKGILTGKLFEYLGSKKPIIGIGPTDSDAEKIVTDCEAGRMISYGDVKELSLYLEKLYEQWENNRLAISNKNIEKYTRKTLAGLLANEIQNLT